MVPSDEYLRMRLDDKTRRRLDALAARDETTRSEIVRRALRDYAARKKVSAAELAAVAPAR